MAAAPARRGAFPGAAAADRRRTTLSTTASERARAGAASQALLEEFTRSSLSGWSGAGQVAQHGAYLYRLPEAGLDLKGLHTIHPGLWLGTLKKNRFEPSQALAMSLKAEQALQVIRLDEAGALDYLRGRSLPAPGGETGWALITLQGFALGWGKCSQGSVKNYYPHGLRWQS